MRPVRGRPSRSYASDEMWRNSKATAMVIGGPIVATDAVCAPVCCKRDIFVRGGVGVRGELWWSRILCGVWPKFD